MEWTLVLIAVLAGIGWWVVRRGGLVSAKFVVTVRGPGIDGIEIRGQVPGHDAADIAEFVAGLDLPPGAMIWGVPDQKRTRLRFTKVPDRLQQRTRNFFFSRG